MPIPEVTAAEAVAGLLDSLNVAVRQLLTENRRLREASTTPSNRKKLSRRDVADIRGLDRAGATNREIAEIFDISPSTVSRTVNGTYHKGV